MERDRMGQEIDDPTLLMIVGAARIIHQGIATRSESDPLTVLLARLAPSSFASMLLERVQELECICGANDIDLNEYTYEKLVLPLRLDELDVRPWRLRRMCLMLAEKWMQESDSMDARERCAEELKALVKP